MHIFHWMLPSPYTLKTWKSLGMNLALCGRKWPYCCELKKWNNKIKINPIHQDNLLTNTVKLSILFNKIQLKMCNRCKTILHQEKRYEICVKQFNVNRPYPKQIFRQCLYTCTYMMVRSNESWLKSFLYIHAIAFECTTSPFEQAL